MERSFGNAGGKVEAGALRKGGGAVGVSLLKKKKSKEEKRFRTKRKAFEKRLFFFRFPKCDPKFVVVVVGWPYCLEKKSTAAAAAAACARVCFR